MNLSSHNRVCQLLQVRYPIIQAGMVWTSGWKLASAVSNAGAFGLIGSGSMYPDVLSHHIRRCKAATDKPFGVNLPLHYPDIEAHIDIILREKIKVVVTSAGNPASYTSLFKKEGITVVHVVSSTRFAQKCVEAGVDAIVAEGFEAGGHNGREETTTFCLIPQVRQAIEIPLIAAGGIGSGAQMLAAMALGAEGVQVGSRFVCSTEASCHPNFKEAVLSSQEGDTQLTLKEFAPVRLLKNEFFQSLQNLYAARKTKDEIAQYVGKARAKLGMFEGDLIQGKLEIGQVSASIHKVSPAAEIVSEIWNEFLLSKARIADL